MDWIRRNLFFDRKRNKRSEENRVVNADDDEFIDIVAAESLESCETSESFESIAASPAISNSEEKPLNVKKVARKPVNHQIVCLSEAAPDYSFNYDPEAVRFVRPKSARKKNGNFHQPPSQLHNNIIHQPR